MINLSDPAEECATFYAKMLDHDYTTKEVFNKNFFKVNWHHIVNVKRPFLDSLFAAWNILSFGHIQSYFTQDWRKIMTDDERNKIRDFSKCDFSEMSEFFKKMTEERKNR